MTIEKVKVEFRDFQSKLLDLLSQWTFDKKLELLLLEEEKGKKNAGYSHRLSFSLQNLERLRSWGVIKIWFLGDGNFPQYAQIEILPRHLKDVKNKLSNYKSLKLKLCPLDTEQNEQMENFCKDWFALIGKEGGLINS